MENKYGLWLYGLCSKSYPSYAEIAVIIIHNKCTSFMHLWLQGHDWAHAHPPVYRGFPGGSVVKNQLANAGDTDSVPGWGRSSGEGNGNPLQHFGLGNPMDRGAWQATFHGVVKRAGYNLATKQQLLRIQVSHQTVTVFPYIEMCANYSYNSHFSHKL